MSNVLGANVPAQFDSKCISNFTVSNSTIGKVIVDQTTAAAATGTTPLFWGGCTVIDLVATSTDASARDISLYTGTVITTQNITNTGSMSTTTSSIIRASGSFVADGWAVGDLVMLFAPKGTASNASVDGIPAVITAVTTTSLTVNGTPFAVLALAAATRIVKVAPWTRITVAATAGTNNAVASVSLLGNNSGSLLTCEKKLGINDILIALMPVAVSALPACVSVTAQVAYY